MLKPKGWTIQRLFRYVLFLLILPMAIATFYSYFFYSVYRVVDLSMAPTLHPRDWVIVKKKMQTPRIIDFHIPFRFRLIWHRLPTNANNPGHQSLKRNDIILFEHPLKDYQHIRLHYVLMVKRIIALPNDRFVLHKGKIWINGEEEEPFLANQETVKKPVYKIPGYLVDYIPPEVKSKGFRAIHAFRWGIPTAGTVPKDMVLVLGDNRTHSIDSRHPSIGFIPFENIVGTVVYKVSWRQFPFIQRL